jgi:hypothetical protein
MKKLFFVLFFPALALAQEGDGPGPTIERACQVYTSYSSPYNKQLDVCVAYWLRKTYELKLQEICVKMNYEPEICKQKNGAKDGH